MMPRSLLGRLLLLLFVSTALALFLPYAFVHRGNPRGPAFDPGARDILRAVRVLEVVEPEERRAVLDRLALESPFVRHARFEDVVPERGARADAEDSELQRALQGYRLQSLGADERGARTYRVRLDDGTGLRFELADATARPRPPPWYLAGFGIPLLVLLLAGGVLVIARQLTGPLARVARAADALGRDFRQPPIPEEGPLEARKLAHAFNLLRERLLAYVERRTQILAAMSHDLRTPLTRLRLRAELIPSQSQREQFEKDLNEMHTLVESTLDLLRGVGRAEPFADVDLGELLEELREEFVDLGRDVELDCEGLLLVRCRRVAMKRCIRNLIENAVKYGTRASIHGSRQGGDIVVQVQDDGPGISHAEAEAVFTPFYRVESSRSRATGGLGLGLAIAREIAIFHRATLTLANVGGGGALFELRFPAAVIAEIAESEDSAAG